MKLCSDEMVVLGMKMLFVGTLLLCALPAQAQDDGAASDVEEVRAAPTDSPAPMAQQAPSGGLTVGDGLSPLDNVKNHVGIGYFTGQAPLGARYWMNRNFGFDVGGDFALTSGRLDALRWGLDVGAVMALSHYHYSVVFVRTGIGMKSSKTLSPNSTPAIYDINASVFLGAELFLGAFGFPNVSLQGGYGIQAGWTVLGGTEFTVGAANAGLNLLGSGTLGFHIYL